MSTQQLQLVCDSSTLANYKEWAQEIADWLRTLGFTATADTGQVYPGDAVGVPGSGAYDYEIYRSPETPYYYLKIMYGNVSGTNCPSLQVGLASGTDGAGNLTGQVVGPIKAATASFTPPSTTVQYECNFSGSGGNRVGVMMWRNGTNNCQQLFVVERSLDSNGAYTAAYVTLVIGGYNNNDDWAKWSQQSLVFGVGVTPTVNRASGSGVSFPSLSVRFPAASGASSAFGSIPVDMVTPNVGYFDYPMTMLGFGSYTDIVEAVPFTIDLYGSSVNFIPTKTGKLPQAFSWYAAAAVACCMRYD